MLPGGEIWLCDLDSGTWEQRRITGAIPSDLSGFCGSLLNGMLYIFGGHETIDYYSLMFRLDLAEQSFSWVKVTDTDGMMLPMLCKHSCWVHRGRLIYFGGYGCKTSQEHDEIEAERPSTFIREAWSFTILEEGEEDEDDVDDAICWGWNNEVNVFDTHLATWFFPETCGPAPSPRGCHASALLGYKGYVCGGGKAPELDMFCLDLDTWTWTQIDAPSPCAPLGRSMHTMTAVSHHGLFIYGGLGVDGNTLNDAWEFNVQKNCWKKLSHPHQDKPRVCHTASLGSDSDVVVFGGSSNLCILMDSVAVLRASTQTHCRDIIIFQTQLYSLFRLCKDFIRNNPELFQKSLNRLPSKLRSKVRRRK